MTSQEEWMRIDNERNMRAAETNKKKSNDQFYSDMKDAISTWTPSQTYTPSKSSTRSSNGLSSFGSTSTSYSNLENKVPFLSWVLGILILSGGILGYFFSNNLTSSVSPWIMAVIGAITTWFVIKVIGVIIEIVIEIVIGILEFIWKFVEFVIKVSAIGVAIYVFVYYILPLIK